MHTLFTFPASFGHPSHSPFCVKAMCLLEMAGTQWQPEYFDNPTPMPLGKLPVLRTSTRMIPDSAFIQSYLETQGADFCKGLSLKARAQVQAMMRLAEDSLYLHIAHDRWLDDRCWPTVRDTFFSAIPALVRKPVTNRIRKTVRRGLISQGFARFSQLQRLAQLEKDLAAISGQLGTQAFLFGDAPTSADASVAPGLGMLLELPAKTETQQMITNWDGLPEYVARCQAAMFPGAKAQLSVAA